MKIGELVWLDMGYANSYGKKKPFQLAIIRDIVFKYEPPRYHLTIVATGENTVSVRWNIFPLEE